MERVTGTNLRQTLGPCCSSRATRSALGCVPGKPGAHAEQRVVVYGLKDDVRAPGPGGRRAKPTSNCARLERRCKRLDLQRL